MRPTEPGRVTERLSVLQNQLQRVAVVRVETQSDAAARPLVRMVRQRGRSDCMVASLAMLVGVDYEVAEAALARVPQARIEDGAGYSLSEACAAAAMLGCSVRLVPTGTFDPGKSSGLLSIWTESAGHVFLVSGGLVFDPDGTVWTLSDYLSVQEQGAGLGELIVREGSTPRSA
jgi:hypothetical protein